MHKNTFGLYDGDFITLLLWRSVKWIAPRKRRNEWSHVAFSFMRVEQLIDQLIGQQLHDKGFLTFQSESTEADYSYEWWTLELEHSIKWRHKIDDVTCAKGKEKNWFRQIERVNTKTDFNVPCEFCTKYYSFGKWYVLLAVRFCRWNVPFYLQVKADHSTNELRLTFS